MARLSFVITVFVTALSIGACGDGRALLLPPCPTQGDAGIGALRTGDPCPGGFVGCTSYWALCDSHTTCTCVDGKVECSSTPAREGQRCGELDQPLGRSCGIETMTATQRIGHVCSCTYGRWSCTTSATCPRKRPEDGSRCEEPYLSEDPRCHYFYQRTKCDYLDLYWNCWCREGKWDCTRDLEDCYFRYDASVPVTLSPDGGV